MNPTQNSINAVKSLIAHNLLNIKSENEIREVALIIDKETGLPKMVEYMNSVQEAAMIRREFYTDNPH